MDLMNTDFGKFFRLVEIENKNMRVPVKGREFLAGSKHPHVPTDIPDASNRISIIEPADTSESILVNPQFIIACKAMIAAHLISEQAVVLRNFELKDRAQFEIFIQQLGYDRFDGHGGIAVRQREKRSSMNASDEDPRITLAPHNEMSYLARYPGKIFFYCDTQAESGGEVPVNDVRDILPFVPNDIRQKFEKLGVRYYRMLPRDSEDSQVGWVDTFGTFDKTKIGLFMRDGGYEFEWADNDRLKYFYQRPSTVPHPGTGEPLWFNQITELNSSYWREHPHFQQDLAEDAYPATTTYGDGSPIDAETINRLRAALWRGAYALRMQKHDLLVLDNQLMQHGRFAYEGYRRHYVSMAV